jgi:two-component system sensor histidine kinase QseC
LLAVSITTLLVWLAAGVGSYFQALHEAEELMDGQLSQSARLLMALVLHDPDNLAAASPLARTRGDNVSHPYEQPLEFRIQDRSGRVLLQSSHTPEPVLPPAADAKPVFADIHHAGQPWRMLSIRSPDGRYLVHIAHPIQDRDRVGLEVAGQVALPILLALPLLALLVYVSVRRSLKPLEELASDVASRSPDNLENLSEPLALREAQPLVAALNRLLTRLAATLDNERRFTADAAHELRTPLAAVKIQAQVALASIGPGSNPADHQHALRQVLAGADRATRLVEQLLRLARLDPLARLPHSQPVDLAALAASVVADMQGQAIGKQQQLSCIAPAGGVRVLGDADLLGVALRNLIENALRYTPAAGVIEVHAEMVERVDAHYPLLCVRDSGPGVDAAEAPRLLERFYRGQAVANATDSNGSGLGLAIVQRIAELHAARLSIENRVGGGLEVSLRWNGNFKNGEC